MPVEDDDPRDGAIGAALPRERPPVLFVVPGAFGEDPPMRDFRNRLHPSVGTVLVDHPGPEAPDALIGDMDAMGRRVAETIVRKQADGPVMIVGNSFGGSVAAAAALTLATNGREVAFLGIVDAPLGTETVRNADDGDYVRSPTARIGRAALKWAGATDGTRRITAAVSDLTHRGSKRAESARRYLMFHRFGMAMDAWKPGVLPFAGVLATTSGMGEANKDLWLGLAPRMTHLHCRCRHQEIMVGPHLDALCSAVLEGLGMTVCLR